MGIFQFSTNKTINVVLYAIIISVFGGWGLGAKFVIGQKVTNENIALRVKSIERTSEKSETIVIDVEGMKKDISDLQKQSEKTEASIRGINNRLENIPTKGDFKELKQDMKDMINTLRR